MGTVDKLKPSKKETSEIVVFPLFTSNMRSLLIFSALLATLALRDASAFTPLAMRPAMSSVMPSKSAAPKTRQLSLADTTDFGSDFGSAMPEKPEISLEDRMNESADDFIVNMESQLGDTEPPPELLALKEARQQNKPIGEVTLKVYELMIERGMRYDEDPDTGSLTPTDFDIPNNLDIPEVQQEFAHLYKYGMMLMNKGLLTADQVKGAVLERLIKRTGLTPEKFDEWLGY